MPSVDNHVHVLISGPKRILHTALEERIDHISITEHVYQFVEVRRHAPFSGYPTEGRLMKIDRYFESIRTASERSSGPDVGVGIEVDYVPTMAKEWNKELNFEWDIVLCSVHKLWGVDVDQLSEPLDESESTQRWQEYFHLMHQAIDCSVPRPNVIAHPTRLMVSTPRLPLDIEEKLSNLAEHAARKGMVLELNVDDLITNPTAVTRVAKACERASTPISVGTDAHSVSELRNREGIGKRFLEKTKLQVVTYRVGKQLLLTR